MSKSNLNLEKLLKVSTEVLERENFEDDLQIIRPSISKTNIWKKIAENYFDNDDQRKDLTNIYSWWSRNTKNFRNLLTENFTKISKEISDRKKGNYKSLYL